MNFIQTVICFDQCIIPRPRKADSTNKYEWIKPELISNIVFMHIGKYTYLMNYIIILEYKEVYGFYFEKYMIQSQGILICHL